MKRMVSILLTLCLLSFTAFAQSDTYPLIANVAGPEAPEYAAVAEVAAPEGYVPLDGVSPNYTGAEPEYYFVPEDSNSPVRFLYYTTGSGNGSKLAENAIERYHTFYEVFEAGEITSTFFAEKECINVTYTCSYAGQDGITPIYEQSSLCYFPITEHSFIACIVSLAFDSAEEYLNAEAMNALLEQAAAAITMNTEDSAA